MVCPQRQPSIPRAVRSRPGIEQKPMGGGSGDQRDRRAVLAIAVHGTRGDRYSRRRLRWPLHDTQQRDESLPTVQFKKMLKAKVHTPLVGALRELLWRQERVLCERQREAEQLAGLHGMYQCLSPRHGQRHPPRPPRSLGQVSTPAPTPLRERRVVVTWLVT